MGYAMRFAYTQHEYSHADGNGGSGGTGGSGGGDTNGGTSDSKTED